MDGTAVDPSVWVSPWLSCLVLFAAMMVAAAVGRRVGLAKPGRNLPAESFDLNVVEGALFGLLGLLIAFTYSFVMVRDDHRKAAVIAEANAIGTAYLRADLAPEPARTELRDLLRRYARTRILLSEAVRNRERFDAAVAESLAVQNRLWPTAAGALRGRTPTVADALLLGSINEVIDSHGRRLAAARDRLPSIVLLMLMIVALVAVGLTGYASGVAEHRKGWRTTTIAVTISAVMLIILDLDEPRTGLIRVSQQVLVDTLNGMGPAPATGPAATSPARRGER
jgi:hypothetical protein